MGGDQTGCQCQRTGLFTALFKEVSSDVHQVCWDIFPSLLLGEELTVSLMFSLTHHRLPHNPLSQHQQPTHCCASQWTSLTPHSFFWGPVLSAGGHCPTCSWRPSHLASCVLPQAWQQQDTWDSYSYSPSHLQILQDSLQTPGTSSHSWYSPTLLLRGQLAASGRATSKTGSSSDGVQVTLGCRGCSTAPQHSPAHQGITAGLQHQLQTQPGLINWTIYTAALWAFHPNRAGKGGKGLYCTFSPHQVSRKSSGWSGCISRWVNHGSLWSSITPDDLQIRNTGHKFWGDLACTHYIHDIYTMHMLDLDFFSCNFLKLTARLKKWK